MVEIQELTDDDFREAIREGVTLVDFWAKWCGPCLLQEPVIKRVSEKVGHWAKVAKVDVDHAQNTAAQLGIELIPTPIVFKEGIPVRQIVGLAGETDILKALDEAH